MIWGVGGGTLVIFLAVALPPLNPVAPGPSPQVFPLLVSWLCCATLIALYRPARVWPISWGWLLAALVSSVIALSQYIGVAELFTPWMNTASAGEAFGNLRQRNQFATLTNIGLAVILWWLADVWQRDAEHTTQASPLVAPLPFTALAVPAAFAVLALLVTANAASASRTGILQLVMIVLLAGAWKSSYRWRLFATAVAGLAMYVLAAAVLPVLLERFFDVSGQNVLTRLAREEGCSSRKVLWSNVLHLIGQKPWAGWGWGELDYAHYATLYPGERFCDILDNAHNLPLHLAVELGIPVALLGCAGICWLVLRAAPWRAVHPDQHLAWTVLAAIAVHSMVEYPLWYGPFQMAAGLSILLLWQAGRAAAEDTQTQAPTRPDTLARQCVAAAITGAVLFAAWDYHRVSELYLPSEQRSARLRDDTLNKVKGSWLFRNQTRFAELSITPLTPANATTMADLAAGLLHYSPERRVIETLIDSLMLLRREDEALWHIARYRAAFPNEFEAWSRSHRAPGSSAP